MRLDTRLNEEREKNSSRSVCITDSVTGGINCTARLDDFNFITKNSTTIKFKRHVTFNRN